MEKKSLLFKSKKGATSSFTQTGIDLGLGAIFVLAIGLTITEDVISTLITNQTVNGTPLISGTTATVAGFVGLVIVAAFIFGVAKLFNLV